MADEVQPLQRRTKIDGTVNIGGLQKAITDVAVNTNFLGEMGASLAQKASTTINENLGYEDGKTPDDSSFIPITDADKVYKKAYDASASMTLTNQFQKLSLGAQVEVNGLNKITTDTQNTFLKTMMDGKERTLANAPASIRAALSGNFDSHIAVSMANLQNKKITQDKADQADQTKVDNKVITSEIYNQGYGGSVESAVTLTAQSEANTQKLFEAGSISASSKDTIDSTNRITMWSGILSGGAKEASILEQGGKESDRGSLAKFLTRMEDSLNDKKVAPQEQEAIIKNVMASIKSRQSAKEKDQALRAAQFKNDLVQGKVGAQDINNLYNTQPTLKAQNLEITARLYGNRTSKTQQNVNNLVASPGDQAAYLNATPEQRKQAFNSTVSSLVNNGMDVDDARIQAGTQFYGEVKINTDTINADASQTDPAAIQRAIKVYDGINATHPNNVKGVTFDSINRMESFKNKLSVSGNQALAAIQTQEDFGVKSKDQQDAIDKGWNSALAKNIGNSVKDQNSAMLSAVNDSWGMTVMGTDALRAKFLTLLKSAWRGNNMNFAAAQNATNQEMRRSVGEDTTWTGTSRFPGNNGIITTRPIQSEFGVGTKDPGLMQTFIVDHIKNVFDQFNSASSTSKFRMVKRETSLEEANILKENLDFNPFFPLNSPAKDRKFNRQEDSAKYDKFLAGQNIEFDIIDQNQIKTRYTTFLTAEDTINNSPDGTKGGWQVSAIDSKGVIHSLVSLMGNTHVPPIRLRQQDVHARYIKHVGTGAPEEDAGVFLSREVALDNKKKAFGIDESFEQSLAAMKKFPFNS